MFLDQSIFNFFYGLSGKFWLPDRLFVFSAKYLGYLMLGTAAVLFLKERNWKKKVFNICLTSLSIILSRGLIAEIFKVFLNRERPFAVLGIQTLIPYENGYSFPSGHMALYGVLALAVFFLLSRKWGWVFMVCVLLIGISRIAVGLHWPSDILGGLAIAGASYFLTQRLLGKYRKKL